jgi:glycerophosphoryl diester phosphodiesterase
MKVLPQNHTFNVINRMDMKQILTAIIFIAMMNSTTKAQKEITSWNKNKVIAHRGAWKKNGLPENSIASLKEAIRLKCFGSEFDVHMTKDSVLVVNHDPNFQGMSIPNSTYAELLTKKHSNGEFIPTAEQYLKAGIKQKTTKLIFEIKPQKLGNERDRYLAERCLQLVKKLKAERWVEYISFGYDICQYIVKNAPEAKVHYLAGDVEPAKIKADSITGIDYPIAAFKKNDWFEPAKKLGVVLNVWTVNKVDDMNFFLDNNVDFITTNEPELLFETIANRER